MLLVPWLNLVLFLAPPKIEGLRWVWSPDGICQQTYLLAVFVRAPASVQNMFQLLQAHIAYQFL
jgi:Na+-transporting NADH:ubiquinone oxidoreductase subunit NqrB